jgi:DNA helicase-2/ATP-dependent DNA helicase PcrA
MYYDHEPGETSYTSPVGKIQGVISLKRQYRIRNGQLEYMIENSLTIHDDILQKELSSNADDKMKNIVATIQREQNKIIRNEEAHPLIIQGVAGSGKTSIALHRIVYLLYTFKESISSKDILIISPNKVFADYIANVLPELGEETVPETNMEQILSSVLDNKYKYQNFFDQVNEILIKSREDFIDRVRYKSSFDFVTQLDNFILHIENTYFKAADVQFSKYVTIPSEFIEEQFRRFNRYSMRKRFEAMTEYILEITTARYRLTITTAERNMLIRKMFARNDDIQVYKDFLECRGCPKCLSCEKSNA